MSQANRSAAAVFDAALQLPRERRAAYLAEACGGDARLRQRVAALLRAHDSAGEFMADPASPPRPDIGQSLDLEPDEQDADSEAALFAQARENQPAVPLAQPNLKPGSPDAPSDDLVGQTIGRYKLLEKVGEGGCGAVYVAEQREPVRRRVALKVIKLGMDSKAVVARFEAERQALAMMDHPNIAKVLDAGATERGGPYFVMELVRGIPITHYCDQAQLTTQERLELFIKVCQAVQHAHQKGVIHRDIKPSNILVTLHDGVPVPKVIDFGIAKAIEGRLTDHTVYTQLHQFIGTPAYMSPEQAEMTGLDIDTRSDIYSLGVLLYELLAGSTPFDTKELMDAGLDAMRKILREREPVRPSTRFRTLLDADSTVTAQRRSTDTAKLTHQLRGDLDWIVMKCLEKDRTRRYETANGLAFDLQRHLSDEPVLARPPSTAYRFQKAFRRHKLVFTATAVTATALVAGIGVSTWQTLAARKAGREADLARQRAVEAARSEGEQKRRAEETVQLMQIEKAEDLFGAQQSALAVAYLGRVLRANPSNEVAAARLASAVLRPFSKELSEPLRHGSFVYAAEFSPDGLRLVTASDDHTARIWDARTGEPLTEPLRHSDCVNSARFSPDGFWVVTASHDHTARVWDARTGKAATDPLQHDDNVQSAEFSRDGLRVVTASYDRTARVWDARTGRPVTGPLGAGYYVVQAQFSPDGARVLTASWDSAARVWDVHTGQLLTNPLEHNGFVNSARFSPDGSQVVTASTDGTARVWDARTGQPVAGPLRHNSGSGVSSAEFSPDGLRVVTASLDRTARVWDARTGQPLTEPIRHQGSVLSAQFSPDGLRVVTASEDSTARIWDASTGQPLTEPIRHQGSVLSARFSPDGLGVLTASADKTARVWEACPGQALTEPLRHKLGPRAEQWRFDGSRLRASSFFAPSSAMRSAQFSPDGLRVVTASLDHTAQVWDARTGQPLTEPLQHLEGLGAAQFSPDGLCVVTFSGNGAGVWDARTGQPVAKPLLQNGTIRSARISPDGLQVVTAAAFDPTARLWDARSGEPVNAGFPHDRDVVYAEFSPDSLRVVTASADRTARVWDARTGQPVTDPLRHDNGVSFAQFSPDGLRVVTASADGTARVWDARTGQPLAPPLRHENEVSSAEFSPDGSWIVSASKDGTARVWGARTGKPLTEPLRHEGALLSARFSPNSARVVTASVDRTARVWDARTGQPLMEPLRHAGVVWSASFSPDGARVVTASEDGTARIWEVTPPSLPVPAWFIDWAEARAGIRFDAAGAREAVPFSDQRRQRDQVRSRTDTNLFARLARWVEANPSNRPLSPNAMGMMPEHVRRLVEANTLASLHEALLLSPTQNLAWARLALHLADGEGVQTNLEARLAAADADAQRALKLEDGQAEAWQAAGIVQWLRHQPAAALASLGRALALRPEGGESWELKGDILQREQRPVEALEAYGRLTALFHGSNATPGSAQCRAVIKHAAICRELGRGGEAAADLRTLGVTARPPGTTAQLVDLSAFYNAGLGGDWAGFNPDDENFAAMPTGIQILAGTRFDVRGVVQICSGEHLVDLFPDQVRGIRVGAKGGRVRFVQGVMWGMENRPGTPIGKYVLHYADGAVCERPLVLGRDALNWTAHPPPPGEGNPTVAWSRPARPGEIHRGYMALYVVTWENPRPDVEIASLDLVSTRQSAAPFLVAVTLE